MAPIGMVLAGVVVLREHFRAVQRVALALAVVAVALLTASYGAVPVAALGIAASWTTYSFVKKHSTLLALESMAAEMLVLVGPSIVLAFVFAGSSSSVPSSASTGEWLLLGASFLVTLVPLVMFARGAKGLPLTVMALGQYIVPTINFLLGWLAYDEELDGMRVAGFIVVWIAVAAVMIDSLRRRTRVGDAGRALQRPAAVPPVASGSCAGPSMASGSSTRATG
jgi:chloramphenicol-sensitive protein RarD